MYSGTGEGDMLSSSTLEQPCQRFSLEEIQSATNFFDDYLVIGHGGFGNVYEGRLSTKEPVHLVAIKRLNLMSNQGEHEFRAEIQTLSKLRHCHLVSLIGYCDDKKEMILVYEYMPNGTLYHHLHKAETVLSWVQRMKIAIGSGRGLDYLHTGVGTEHGIIHRDVKSSNILLNENMEAKISDFGLSKIGPINQSSSCVDASAVKGTFGYLDPEYFYTKKFSRKTDVYAFGVVLFELLTGRLAVDESLGEEQCSLVRWAKKCVKERKLDQMVDSNIKGTIFPKCLRRFAQIAHHCVHSIPKERPTMTEVVASLQAALEIQLKSDNSVKSSGKIGFIWKIHKYLPIATKQNSDQCGTSSPTNWHGSFHDEWTHRNGAMVLEGIKEFTYDELKHATGNFQETCLGKGIHGVVYKGWVDKLTYSPCNRIFGLPVEVKIYDVDNDINIGLFRRCLHPNLFSPIGYCKEGEQLFFVYESMHNGNFEGLLCSGVVSTLPLIKKVKIAFGVARGILFYDKMGCHVALPSESEPLLERRDIMLDKDFTAKLLYYHATYEPSQPDSPSTSEYFSVYSSSPKGEPLQIDLSGFTVIFAEVVTGRRIFNERELDIIDDKLLRHGKMSMRQIARFCFGSCYTAESELKMLEFLKEYDNIVGCQDRTLNIEILEDSEDETIYTSTNLDETYKETLEEFEEETFSTSFESCL